MATVTLFTLSSGAEGAPPSLDNILLWSKYFLSHLSRFQYLPELFSLCEV